MESRQTFSSWDLFEVTTRWIIVIILPENLKGDTAPSSLSGAYPLTIPRRPKRVVLPSTRLRRGKAAPIGEKKLYPGRRPLLEIRGSAACHQAICLRRASSELVRHIRYWRFPPVMSGCHSRCHYFASVESESSTITTKWESFSGSFQRKTASQL